MKRVLKNCILNILIFSSFFILIMTNAVLAKDVTVTWDANQEPDLAGYRVYYDTDSGVTPFYPDPGDYPADYSVDSGGTWIIAGLAPPIEVQSGVTEIKFRGLNDNKVYYFAIAAFDGPQIGLNTVVSGEGELSDPISTLGVTSIKSDDEDRAYRAGEAIDIDVLFTESVTLSGGNLLIALDSGVTVEIVPFVGTNSTTTYTIQAGEKSDDLNVISLSLSGTTLQQTALPNSDVPLSLPIGKNLADNNAIVVDTVAPESSATAPELGDGELSITWTASDATSGVSETVLWYAKSAITPLWTDTGLGYQVGTSGTFAFTPPSGDGAGTFLFATQSTDKAGNDEAEPSGLTGDDNTAYKMTPVITTNDGENYSTASSSITLGGTITERTDTVKVNTTPVDVQLTDTTWSYNVSLSAGENIFSVIAVDAFGNESSADTITVTYDAAGATPPVILTSGVIPHDGAGEDPDITRVPNNTSFSVRIRDADGIDMTQADSVEFSINDGTDTYTRNLGDTTTVRYTILTGTDTRATDVWVVYDRSKDTSVVYPYEATVTMGVDAKDHQSYAMDTASYSFKVESETTHDLAAANSPATSSVAVDDPALGGSYDAGIEVTTGDLEGAKIVYDSSESVTPTLGPSDEIPDLDYTGSDAVGVPLNLQPPTVFSTPVKIFIPCPDTKDVSSLSVFLYNGEEWVLACNAAGVVQAGADGWMVPDSRVDHNDTDPPTIEIQVYHFTGVIAGSLVLEEIGSTSGGCFIATAAYGSSFERHVEILRKFRDVYLLPTRLGNAFVDVYYKYAPPAAAFIGKHEGIRAAVRIGLVPVVGMSYLALHTTAVEKIGIMLLLMVFLMVGCVYTRKVKGSYFTAKTQGTLRGD
ncbi:CFI-box-CTERM domain-containing protein [Thermodesulfobacteriota bacterium]